MLHGTADDHVHWQHSQDYAVRLDPDCQTQQFKWYSGASHMMDEGAGGTSKVFGDIVSFLDQWIKPGEGGRVTVEDSQLNFSDATTALYPSMIRPG